MSLETQALGLRRLLTGDRLDFARKFLQITTIWDGVERIIRSAFDNRRTAVQSANSMSKDFTAGILVLQWLFTYPGNSKVICNGPTQRQVKEIMFGEIEKEFERARVASPWTLDPDCLKSMKLDLGPDWFALGITTKETGEMIGKMQGFKSPNLLIIVTEAQAVSDNVFDQFYGLLPRSVLELGNPLVTEGRFWEHCVNPRFGYNVIQFSAFESPNVKAGREVIPGMATVEFIEDIRRDWGEDHPYWYGRVLGEFPQSATNSIIPINWIMRQVRRDPDFFSEHDPADRRRVAGLDIAGQGTDETAHITLTGPKVTRISGFHKMHLNELVGWEKMIFREDGYEALAYDAGGLADVGSFLEEEKIPANGFMFGSSLENDKFDNFAAFIWWQLRQAFQDGEVFIPDDKLLIGQLAARRYDPTSKGKLRIKLESKSLAKSRGSGSPDRADALALAWYARKFLLGEGSQTGAADNESKALEENMAINEAGTQLDALSIRY